MSTLGDLATLLDELDCRSYSIHATDSSFYADRDPNLAPGSRMNIRLTIVGRSFFEQVCVAVGAAPTERIVRAGQRSWWAEADTSTRRLLIEGVSFQHHADWEPRRVSA